MQTFQFNTIEEALEDFRQGKMVIVVDDGDAENDGALAVAGQFATPEAVNFMLSHGRGLMTMPISEEIAGKIEEMESGNITDSTDMRSFFRRASMLQSLS